MTEEKIKALIPSFIEGLHLDEQTGRLFDGRYKKILEADRGHIDTKYASYRAALAYITNIGLELKKTQKEIAKIAGCSEVALQRRYKAIVKRNRTFINVLADLEADL